MDYIANIRKAFNIWWDNKYLWILGIICAIFTTGRVSINYNFDTDVISSLPEVFEDFIDYRDMGIEPWTIIVFLAAFVIFWMILGIYFKNKAEASMLRSVYEIDMGAKVDFQDAWKAGDNHWLLLFLQSLIAASPIIILFVLIIILAIVFSISGYDFSVIDVPPFGMILCGLGCGLVIYLIFINTLLIFSKRELVIGGKSLFASLSSGFNTIVENFPEFIMSCLVLIPVGMIKSILSVVVMMVSLFLSIPIGFILIPLFETAPMVVLALGIVILLILYFINSIIRGPVVAYYNTYWTIVYLELKRRSNRKVSRS